MSPNCPRRCRTLAAAFLVLWSVSAVSAPPPDVSDTWPEFRGPFSNGHSPAIGLPLNWSESENIRWKTSIHGRGWSSPVVWGRQVWITTATEDGSDMYVVCVDRDSGRVLLDRKLFHNERVEPLGNDVNAYASPTPSIEDGRVFIHFGSYGTACIDTRSFKTRWTRRDLPCRHYRGPSSSPILFEDLLILTFDGIDLQYTAALNKVTGQTVWKTDRSAEWNDLGPDGKPYMEGDQRKAHSTPVIVSVAGRPQMVSVGAHAAYGYDPRTGKEIWKLPTAGFSASMRPVIGNGMAYVTSGFGNATLFAVRLEGATGLVTESALAWKYSRMVPAKPSPILVDDLLYMVNDSGVATCLDSRTGALVWQERIGGHYSASPICAEGRIYCFSEEGSCLVLKPGRKLEKLAESKLEDGFMASAATAGKALYLRTRSHLYRIERP